MTTKVRDGAIPVSKAVLDAARITEDTPLDIKANGDGKLTIETADSIEKVIEEYADRPLSQEEMDASFARIDALPENQD